MARAKKDVEKEIIEGVKKLPAKKKARVLDLVRKLSEVQETATPRAKIGGRKRKVMSWDEFVEHGLYEGDGTHFDHDEIYREPY
jgi:hypothetical protein